MRQLLTASIALLDPPITILHKQPCSSKEEDTWEGVSPLQPPHNTTPINKLAVASSPLSILLISSNSNSSNTLANQDTKAKTSIPTSNSNNHMELISLIITITIE